VDDASLVRVPDRQSELRERAQQLSLGPTLDEPWVASREAQDDIP
jgi:hypothetical protein